MACLLREGNTARRYACVSGGESTSVCVRVGSKHPKQKCLSSVHLRYRLQLLLVFKLNAGASVAVIMVLSVAIYLSCLLSVHKYTLKKYTCSLLRSEMDISG